MIKIKFPAKVTKPVEDYLKRREKKLRHQKKELEAEDPYINTDRLIDNAAVDTEAAEKSGHERVSALKTEIDKALIEIRKTLTRIKIGKYGICEKCQNMIDTDRLAIKPTATLCINCEKKNSKKNR